MNIDRISDIGREFYSANESSSANRNTSDLSEVSTGIRFDSVSSGEATGLQVQKEPAITPIDTQQAVEKLNQLMRSLQRDVTFSVDEDAQSTVIRVYRTETGELIKQFPPEEILAMMAKIRENIGWLVDNKV